MADTQFDAQDLIPLKAMVANSKPENLATASDHWAQIHEQLLAAAEELRAAVQHAQENWEGAAASGFARKAGEIQQSLSNTAGYATKTSSAMQLASKALDMTKKQMGDIDVPSDVESGWKFVTDLGDRSDAQFKADLAGGMDRFAAVNKNYDELSATEISHQYAIGTMEYLAPYYQQAAGQIPVPPEKPRNWEHDGGTGFPPAPAEPGPGGGGDGSVSPPPSMVKPDGPQGGTAQVPGLTPQHLDPLTPTVPGTPGHTLPGGGTPPHGGVALPPSTGIDGWTPPTTTPGPGGGGIQLGGGLGGAIGAGGGSGGGVGGGGGIAGGGFIPGGLGGGGGGVLGGGRGGGGIAGVGGSGKSGSGGAQRPGGVSGTGTGGSGGAGGASGQGKAGAPGGAGAGGMHGGGMGGGAGGGKGGAGGKGSGLVRRAGGTVGGARPGSASGRAFTEGGSGLGKGRGSAAGAGGAGAAGGAAGKARGGQNGAAGAGGMHGAGGSAGKGKKKDAGHRPDYLVEDEDTWRGGSALPPVIE
ncbi:hypothetical protein [Kitasatospora sp. NPDC094015]|uniref:PPE domain-containing protein n=1 Tax=Kitasatospora sp. NPDC094015 TaxID=3155205 RepID=UPI003330E319